MSKSIETATILFSIYCWHIAHPKACIISTEKHWLIEWEDSHPIPLGWGGVLFVTQNQSYTSISIWAYWCFCGWTQSDLHSNVLTPNAEPSQKSRDTDAVKEGKMVFAFRRNAGGVGVYKLLNIYYRSFNIVSMNKLFRCVCTKHLEYIFTISQ